MSDEHPVQCLCGRRFIPTSPDVFASRTFDGIECDDGCRARFQRYGITDAAPPTRRTQPKDYRRRVTVGHLRQQRR